MTGIIYQLTDNRILTIVPDVLEITETSIKGKNHAVSGVDISQASIRVINPYAVNITQEDVTQEVPEIEEVNGVPTQVMKTQVIGQREIIKVVLAEGGPELGVGDIIDPSGLIDVRGQLPKSVDEQIKTMQETINFLLGL